MAKFVKWAVLMVIIPAAIAYFPQFAGYWGPIWIGVPLTIALGLVIANEVVKINEPSSSNGSR